MGCLWVHKDLFRRFLVVGLISMPCLAQSTGLSEAKYEGKVQVVYTRVPMRDGVELAVKIMRPDAEGKFPAVMLYYPYRALRKPKPDYREEEPSFYPYLAERGYAIVQYDVRGTGNSGGWSKDIYSDDERRDGHDMVEWIAAQPWCNGNVGMMGNSYVGVVQWQVAVQNPPHLKTIIVKSANDNVYTEWTYPGGVLRPYMFDTYSPIMTAYNFAPPDPELVGEKWSEIWQERLENNRPWGIGFITHPLDGPYWQDRSLSTDYSRVKCPVLVIAGWSDVYPTALLRAFSKLKVPYKRALVGPWKHGWFGFGDENVVPGPRIDGRPIYLKWFDYWLKGIDNGIMEEPPVTVFVRKFTPPSVHMPIEEAGFWRSEKDWPVPRAQSTPFYFHAEGQLSRERYTAVQEEGDELEYNPAVGITSGIHWGGGIPPWGMPIDQRWDEAYSLTYTTSPLEEDVEVTGNPQAVLYVSSTADVAYFRVKLIDVAPDGTHKLVRYGGLNATHRNSHFTPEPLVPGQVYELKVDVKAMSYVFEEGHRIRVAIANADPEIALEKQKPTEYSITRDLVKQTTTVRLGSESSRDRGEGFQKTVQRSSFTVSSESPADAHLKANCIYIITRPESEIKVEVNELTASNKAAFRHVVEVEVTVNGARHFNKSWSVTIPG